MGTHMVCDVSGALKQATDGDTGISLGDAKKRIIDAGLWTPQGPKKGKGNSDELLPKRSLVKKDFEESNDEQLRQRASAIAKAIGDSTARGRIGSLKLMAEGIDTFDKWWARAKPVNKTRLFSDHKHHKDFTADDHLAFARAVVQCPFRGPVPAPQDQDQDDEEPVPPKKRNGSPTTTA